MRKVFTNRLFHLFLVFLLAQSASAQTSDEMLKKIALQAKVLVLEAGHLELEEGEPNSFGLALVSLVDDLESWAPYFPSSHKRAYAMVSNRLESHADSLSSLPEVAKLTPEQAAKGELLLRKLREASAKFDEFALKLAVGVGSPEMTNRVLLDCRTDPGYNAWGGPWGNWSDGSGPYFGRPFPQNNMTHCLP